jgi:HEAT repeat protein
MRFPVSCVAAVIALLLAGAIPAAAQFGSTYADNPSGIAGGSDNITDRYNRARRGTTIDEWVRRLKDDDPEIRLEAVKSLGDSGDPKANDYLMQGVGDPDPRIQSKAVEYLGKVQATDATTFLIQRLFMTGTSDPLRHRILMALGKIGDSRASRPLLELLNRDIDPDMRGTAIYALGDIGDTSIRQALEALREREEHPLLKRLISESLVKIETRQPSAPLQARIFPTALEAALQTEPRPQ